MKSSNPSNTQSSSNKSSNPPQRSTKRDKPSPRKAKDRDKEEEPLPIAKETERELLGLILTHGNALLEKAIESGLDASIIHVPSHRTILTIFLDIHGRTWDISYKTVHDHLQTQHLLEKIGGAAFLTQLSDGRGPGPSSVPGLIRQLKDIHYKREAVKKAEELHRLAGNGASPAEIEEFLDSIPRTHVAKQSYFLSPSGIFWRKPPRPGSFGFETEQVTTFGAKIVAEVIADDGSSEEQRIFELEISVKGETRRIEIPGSKFDSMSWVTAQLGADAGVCPGKSEHARFAIKQLSPTFAKRTVYAHTGWRQIGDLWRYLHNAGAITGEGNSTDVAVRLPYSLRFFVLPEPKKGDDMIEAYKHSLAFLDAFPRQITAPLLGSVFAAALGEIDYSVYVVGQSGVFKSELTALIAAFFGAGFNRLTMAANWDDTANVLLSKLFTAKDGVLVIDDFAPNGNKRHDDDLHAKAERIFRAAGNRTGRGRLQSDMTERLAKEPRAMLISSGEDLPRGVSLQARLHIVPIEKGDISVEALTRMQEAAAKGEFASSLATFLSYLARNRDKIKSQFDKDRTAYRERLNLSPQGHARQSTTTGHLLASWRAWITAAVDSKTIGKVEANKLWKEIWKTLAEGGRDQEKHKVSQHPADHFISLLRSALISSRANLQTIDGNQPLEIPKLCGWRDGKPMGECVGWVDNNVVYLELDSAYGIANGQGMRTGEGLSVQPNTLAKRLDERGLIIIKDKGRGNRTRTPVTRITTVAIKLDTLFSTEEEAQ